MLFSKRMNSYPLLTFQMPGMGAEKSEGEYKMVCYFTNWAMYRPGIGKYTPEDIDPSLCTHIVYGFATLDSSTHKMRIFDRWADIDSPSKTAIEIAAPLEFCLGVLHT